MLRNLPFIEQTTLIDQLADYTARYTNVLVKGGRRKDLDNWEKIILELQNEIRRRKDMNKARPVSHSNTLNYLY